MNLNSILNNAELQDIPILYVLRIMTAIQKEYILSNESSHVRKKLFNFNESIKEWYRCFKIPTPV